MPLLTRDNPDGLKVVIATNDVLSLSFLPQCGGRLISLKYKNYEFLWANPKYLTSDLRTCTPFPSWPKPDTTMGSWVNLGGSKTWPAPQGWSTDHEWPGPPDEVLDSGVYAFDQVVDDIGDIHITMTSQEDARTGIQITRTFDIPAKGPNFSQTNSFRNHTSKSKTWSIWEVAQVTTKLPTQSEGKGYFLVECTNLVEPKVLFHLVGDIKYSFTDKSIKVPVQNAIGKVGFTSASGDLAWVRPDGLTLRMKFLPSLSATYPDGGCSVELWHQFPLNTPMENLGGLQPDADLVEMEILSPLHKIEAQQKVSLEILWSIEGKSNSGPHLKLL